MEHKPASQPMEALFDGMAATSRQFWDQWQQTPSTHVSADDLTREVDRSFWEGLEVSERLVHGTIQVEKEMIAQWCGSVSTLTEQPGDGSGAAQQWGEMMESWLDLRTRMWEQWFQEVRRIEQQTLPLFLRAVDETAGDPEIAPVPAAGDSASAPTQEMQAEQSTVPPASAIKSARSGGRKQADLDS
ncbi:hypothetical protein [Aquisalimonas sp.]|uniref:hypothetical protein n=1 Tax=Aquisalimonas sp. TaxID=1872621 RepID=UPI0025C41AAF|nr:hypothetical protein [Aquisalimonas sp.]